MRPRRYLYALAPITMGALVCGAVVVAVTVTLSPAFFTLPNGGTVAPDFGAWRAFAALPGVGSAIALTFAASTGATLASLVVACCVGAWAMTPARRNRALVVAAAVAAVPPTALAAGLSELASPAAASSAEAWWQPWLPGVHAGTGMLLIALCLKIAPFLAAMVLIAMPGAAADRHAAAAGALGYGRAETFAKLVLPQVYRRLRLPVCAALAWSLSTVAVPLLVDPASQSQLAVIAWRGLADGREAQRALGAATAAVVLAIALAAIALLIVLEWTVRRAGQAWLRSGRRGVAAPAVTRVGVAAAGAGLALAVAALVAPLMLGGGRSGATLHALAPVAAAAGNADGTTHSVPAALVATLAIGVVAMLVALAATIASLEAEDRGRRRSAWPALLWVPWLVPQIAFVPGIAWTLSDLAVRAPFAAVIVSQLVFVFPCVALALIPSWRALDPRYARCAAALRATPRRVLARVKLPLVARPIAFACALAFAASAGLFLPTRLTAPDRVATLATDVVSNAATSNPREAMLEATLLALVSAIVVAFALDRRKRTTAARAAWQPAAG
ncbi:MAG TPA: hypothetical protein VF925_03785 [Casimicrobiaceae bacterium]